MWSRRVGHDWVTELNWTDLQPAGLLCPWDFSGKNTGVGCHSLLQGIFPTQGSNFCPLCLLYCTLILYHWAIKDALPFKTTKQNTAQGTLQQPGWEGSLGGNGYMYIYGWLPLLSTRTYHNIINQLHCSTKNINKKRKKWILDFSSIFRKICPSWIRCFLLCLTLYLRVLIWYLVFPHSS